MMKSSRYLCRGLLEAIFARSDDGRWSMGEDGQASSERARACSSCRHVRYFCSLLECRENKKNSMGVQIVLALLPDEARLDAA